MSRSSRRAWFGCLQGPGRGPARAPAFPASAAPRRLHGLPTACHSRPGLVSTPTNVRGEGPDRRPRCSRGPRRHGSAAHLAARGLLPGLWAGPASAGAAGDGSAHPRVPRASSPPGQRPLRREHRRSVLPEPAGPRPVLPGLTSHVSTGFAGTPGYLSPEVLRKDPYGKPVDMWACGEYWLLYRL